MDGIIDKAVNLNSKTYAPGTYGSFLKMKMIFIKEVIKKLKEGCTEPEIEAELKKEYNYFDPFK